MTWKAPEAVTSTMTMWNELLPRSMAAIFMKQGHSTEMLGDHAGNDLVMPSSWSGNFIGEGLWPVVASAPGERQS